jgi:heme oxygenase (biliverdin-IX-beta and delta-forming)
MLDSLRTATRAAHDSLERALSLVEPVATRSRFEHVLSRFYGFHLAWEPAADALLDRPGFLAPRRRTALLLSDLSALGVIAAESRPELAFLTNADRAWGSLYVMEGSTLGGQVISRALVGVDWTPPGGLRYFNPYGRLSGSMWRQLRSALDERAGWACEDEVVIGAVSTFQSLHDWLLPFPAMDL